MNKKADAKIVSIYMFGVFIVIVSVILAGIWMYNSTQLDARKIEARILATKISNCLIDQGRLIEGFSSKFDVFSNCNIDKTMEEKGLYHFIIQVKSGEKVIGRVVSGNPDLEILCQLKEGSEANRWAECYELKAFALYKIGDGDEQANVNILAGSNNIGARV